MARRVFLNVGQDRSLAWDYFFGKTLCLYSIALGIQVPVTRVLDLHSLEQPRGAADADADSRSPAEAPRRSLKSYLRVPLPYRVVRALACDDLISATVVGLVLEYGKKRRGKEGPREATEARNAYV